ncbi:MAG: S41 family peptidase [Armatimonadetes bacterium]|nr:S41 family peptidase [Armatimonadota bacterium]MDW8122270.1 S41 family peptidase [Armatimonadota bacterium]
MENTPPLPANGFKWRLSSALALVFLLLITFALGYQVGQWQNALPIKSLTAGTSFRTGQSPASGQQGQGQTLSLRPIQKLFEVYQVLQRNFYDPSKLEEEKLAEGAIIGLLARTGDRYTHYKGPADLVQFESKSHGEFEGIGAELTLVPDLQTGKQRLTIANVFPEQPAAKSGLAPLDRIVKIDGKPTEGMTLEQAVSLIRGPRGTKVTLTIERDGIPEPFDVVITRQRVQIPVLQKKILEANVGYIRLLEFNERAANEVAKVVRELKDAGVKGLILDLRGNAGGLLEAAVEVASIFIPKGPIVTVRSRLEGEQVFEANPARYIPWKVPMLVLVDKQSASASEIVAGALKDHGVARIVGEKTYGKASVQTVVGLKTGGALVVTTGSYFTPSGYDIQAGGGIEPQIKLEGEDADKAHNKKLAQEWIKRGVQHLKANEIADAILSFSRAGELDKDNKEASALFRKAVGQYIAERAEKKKDQQLERAVEILLKNIEPKAAEASPAPSQSKRSPAR